MKRRIALIIASPILVLLVALGISGIISSRADNISDDMVMSGSTLVKYNGSAENVVIPASVVDIGNEAFAGNTNLRSVTLSEGTYTIGTNAFSGCSNLASVVLSDSVSTIGDSAFANCTSLTALDIGKNVKKIGNGSFSGCTSLSYISVSPYNTWFVFQNGALYDYDKKTLYSFLAGYPGNVYRMPDSVTEIKPYSFWGTNNLNEVICSSSLDGVGSYAFAGANGLQNVILNIPVRSLSTGAFMGDKSLMQIVLPVSVTDINSNAFTGCPSDMIIIADDGSYSARYAGENGYLTATEAKLSVSDNNLTVTGGTTSGATGLLTDLPSVTDVSTGLTTQVTATDTPQVVTTSSGITNIVSTGYTPMYVHVVNYDAKPVEGTQVGSSVVVSDKVFVSLGDLQVQDGVVTDEPEVPVYSIPEYSHYNDQSLDSYEFSAGDTSIGMLAFARSSIKSVVIPEGVTEIAYGAFYHCDSLTDVSIPSTVTAVGQYAFDHTPWYENWLNDENASDFLIVGDGVLIGYKGSDTDPDIPDNVKTVAEGVF